MGNEETVETVETTDAAEGTIETVEVAEVPENIRLAEIEVQGAEADLMEAKEAHAEAKREYDRQVLSLRALCRPKTEEYPLLDAAERNAWRSLPPAELKLSAKVETVILDFGLTTLGALSDYIDDQGGWWPKEIGGLGEKGAEEVRDAFVRFWEAHPEYCDAEITQEEPAAA